jgi:hypothetical protein
MHNGCNIMVNNTKFRRKTLGGRQLRRLKERRQYNIKMNLKET